MVLDSTGEVELGYRLLRTEWGKGLATEVSRAWLDFGRHRLGLDRVIAFTHRENAPSLAVMERLGMRFSRTMRLAAADAASVNTPTPASEQLADLLDVFVFESKLAAGDRESPLPFHRG
jgi:RimJ/RimL family protein N-acetyltransferase